MTHNLSTTFEGRTVWAVKVSDTPQINDSSEEDILLMAGFEANSIISVEIALYFLSYLVNNYSQDPVITDFINNREIWILPMMNPDGHDHIVNDTITWEKNRRDNGDGTFGVNLNRNFGFEWGEDDHSSGISTSQNYHGTEAYSEPEVSAILSLVKSQEFVFSLSFSSSGEIITYPWGYTNATATGHELLSEIARDMAMFNNYDVMQASQHLTNRGNVDDWLYEEENVIPFTIFAADEDIPQEGEIESIAKENLQAFLYLLEIADDPNQAMMAEWTFMVYMGGDNNLEDEGIKDINEMETIGSDPNINIVVQFDRAPGEDQSNGDWTDTRRFLIMKDYDTNIINSPLKGVLGEANMAHPQTLLDFINWSVTNYPAEHYFLDLWGHGRGWQGVTLDGADWLEMEEIESVLPKFKERIDVVGFDNCNMAMIEVYSQFIGHVDYIVGSEKEEDALGWPYDTIFQDLKADPTMSQVDLSTMIAEYYVDWAENNSYYSASVSVVDIAKLNDMINRTDSLARQLNRILALYYNEIDSAVKGAEQYARKPHPKDLFHFAELIEMYVPSTPVDLAAKELMEEFQNLILANEFWTSPYDSVKVDNAHGITVWLYDGSSSEFSQYTTLNFAELSFWDEFLASYKTPPQRPDVSFTLDHSLSDSDSDTNNETITMVYETEGIGLDVKVEVFNGENEQVLTIYTNSTEGQVQYTTTFNPYDHGLPSDYYNFYIYLENSTGIPQNYSEAVNIWLGNERPDVVLIGMSLYRTDGALVGGSSQKFPIDGENTNISITVGNAGSNDLVEVGVSIYEGENLIFSEITDLNVGEEENFTATWQSAAGATTVKAFVDLENKIKEVNESNNEISELVDVKPINPADPMIVRGKIYNRDSINIIGANVRIRNLRTGRMLNRTTNENGFRTEIDPEWYQEGDEIEIRGTYNDISDNTTVLAYSADGEVYGNITLKTDLYDALFYFKLILIFVELIGFILVIKYAIKLRKYKKME
jgi:hypothetical protein